jgi:hypothetical protein
MHWIKKGLIFKPDHNFDWMVSHAQVPVVEKTDNDRLRIYFGTRNLQSQTSTTFIDVEAGYLQNILHVQDRPVQSIGKLGCFDDSGVMPSWIVNFNEKKYLYYTGWNTGLTIPYRNSIGISVSEDRGVSFIRPYDGPILDRTPMEPYLCGSPCIIVENDIWRMWYLSGVEWKMHGNIPEPYYHIKYAESTDGIDWKREGRVCIDFKTSGEGGIARPSVLKDGQIYRMWYSYRGGSDYRTNRAHSYRIGYAESLDGLEWVRKDNDVGITVSETGWDSEMIAYPFVIDVNDKRYMFYNGNGFGKSGVGYAVLAE